MHSVIGTDRSAIETRARRLAAALVTLHEELDARERHGRPGGADHRLTLAERAEDLAAITTLLGRTHPLRMAAEHASEVVRAWATAPASTDEGRVGSLSMVIAMSMLRRLIAEERAAA